MMALPTLIAGMSYVTWCFPSDLLPIGDHIYGSSREHFDQDLRHGFEAFNRF